MIQQKVFQVSEYINYWFSKTNEHSLHSPFLFDFHQRALSGHTARRLDLSSVLNIRKQLLNSRESIQVTDFGAGSSVIKSVQRKIQDIVKYSTASTDKLHWLAGIAQYFQPNTIVELGTGPGLQALALSLSYPDAAIYTFEGASALSTIANKNIQELQREKKVTVVEGNIDETLPEFLKAAPLLDFVYIDANHAKIPTLTYFYLILKKCHEQTVIVIDDIHWSEGMAMAWKEIIRHPDAVITIDVYHAGIVLLNSKYTKQHWVL